MRVQGWLGREKHLANSAGLGNKVLMADHFCLLRTFPLGSPLLRPGLPIPPTLNELNSNKQPSVKLNPFFDQIMWFIEGRLLDVTLRPHCCHCLRPVKIESLTATALFTYVHSHS